MYHIKPAETKIADYVPGGLLSKLNSPNSFRRRTLGALTAASLMVAGCSWTGQIPGSPTQDSSIGERVFYGTIDNAIRTGDPLQAASYPVRFPVKVVKGASSIIYDRPIGAWNEISKEVDERELPGIFKFIFAPLVYAKNLVVDLVKYASENPAEAGLDAFIGKTISDKISSDDKQTPQGRRTGGGGAFGGGG